MSDGPQRTDMSITHCQSCRVIPEDCD